MERTVRSRVLIAALAAAGLLLGGAPSPEAEAAPGGPGAAGNEVVTWGASQVQLDEPGNFEDMTVRNLVHTSVGGRGLQVTLSNTAGEQPVTFSPVTVGVQAEGAAVVPGRQHQLTFDGESSVTIEPGETAQSDPLSWTVPADTTLAVSVHTEGDTGPVTGHTFANQVSYTASGDATDDVSGEAFDGTIENWYWVEALTVQPPREASTLAFFGDSITDGVGSTTNANLSWPDQLADRIAHSRYVHRFGVTNQGISANRLLEDGIGDAGLDRFAGDVLDEPSVSTVFVLEGVNDLRWDVATSPEYLTDAYQELISEAHAEGVCVVGATILPFGGSSRWNPEREEIRLEVNEWIRTSGAFDTVVDFDAVVRDPDNPVEMDPRYGDEDHLHPSDEGYTQMAEAVDLTTLDCDRAG
ncbi:MAG TPA: SGNH/GDSL hydrolase family protein [Candidatus Ruania gallistercoris]|uniref:SGNH/GDSL hydrolase family protein n=1 Tax=Candidatus Ruania gallistercoris TaxID=2838746 RepID=A0A9D2EF53_9MICO|nr:SGNH/GDSL hydrolase family protein [Candidatus Ruania gallistercoris]